MNNWRALVLCLLVALPAAGCKDKGDGQGAPSIARAGASSASSSASSSAPAVALAATPTAAAMAEPTTDPTTERCEHRLPPALCTQCNPALAAVFRAKGDWCDEHGFPESFCPICHPDAAVPVVGAAPTVASDWCGGHGLPESKCTKCNPDLVAQFQAKGDWCKEHGFPESACPVCSPQQPPAGAEQAAIEARVVRFASPEIERTAGIETVAAERSQAAPAVTCTARIAFDADKTADVRAIVPGVVRRIRVELGARVDQGAPLFELESTQIGEVQGALQSARERVRTAQANVTRQRELRANDIASARQVEVAAQDLATAQSEVRTAEATLRMAGAAPSAPSGRSTLLAPISGIVVRRPAVIGLLATESVSLATIVDTSVMWAFCDVPDRAISDVAVGQKVAVSVDGSDGAPIVGALTWIAAEVDPRTRTVAARAALPNEDGRLRANQFARARIETGAPRSAVSVPRAAVQRVGEREVVFVRARQGVYVPRVVQRFGDGPSVQVQGRVEPGDLVVTTGAVLLRTEIIPGSIGAGCCEVDAPKSGRGG